MNDPWVALNRTLFRTLPCRCGVIFLLSAALMLAWLVGQADNSLRDAIGHSLHLKFTEDEGLFFGLMLVGSASGYAFYRLFRGYVNSR